MPIQPLSSYLLPIFLLIGSNAFMTTAWYWHLRYKEVPLLTVIFISWGLAFIVNIVWPFRRTDLAALSIPLRNSKPSRKL